MEKAEFVKLLETLVKTAMPNISSVVFAPGGVRGDEYVLVKCNSGADYVINVTGDSLMATAYDVTNFLRFK